MTKFKAKVTQDIPANRLIGLGGINTEGDPEEGWETIYLILSKKGWIPDLVSTSNLEKGSVVEVTIKNNPVWKVESSEDLPAGTLVQCDDDGRVKHYRPEDGNHFGFTTHSVKAGEVVQIVRKYGHMPQNQVEAASFNAEEFEQTENDDDNQAADSEFPKHTGGGYYELSNGEKVQGKDKAIEAEQALKSGE
jgi:hypothetical protein